MERELCLLTKETQRSHTCSLVMLFERQMGTEDMMAASEDKETARLADMEFDYEDKTLELVGTKIALFEVEKVDCKVVLYPSRCRLYSILTYQQREVVASLVS